MKKFSELGIENSTSGFIGDKIKIDRILNREIIVHEFEIKDSKFDNGSGKCLYIQIELDGNKRVLFTGSVVLMDTIQKIADDDFPFTTKIIKDNDHFEFT